MDPLWANSVPCRTMNNLISSLRASRSSRFNCQLILWQLKTQPALDNEPTKRSSEGCLGLTQSVQSLHSLSPQTPQTPVLLHPHPVSQESCTTPFTLVPEPKKALPHPSGIPSPDTCGTAVFAVGAKDWPHHLPGAGLGGSDLPGVGSGGMGMRGGIYSMG